MKLTKKQQLIGLAIHIPILPLTLTLVVLGKVSKRMNKLDVFLANQIHSKIKQIK
jgi:hypothetical protein